MLAIADAALNPDLAALPNGVDAVVGERGITLSGGQKQRTALARALLLDPPILILDDAFASVDTTTEAAILANVKRRRRGRTTIIVSHRISALQHADEILVLERGRLVDKGTHDALMRRGGLYAEAAQRQAFEQRLDTGAWTVEQK